jgi:hypothetical protein
MVMNNGKGDHVSLGEFLAGDKVPSAGAF